MRDFYDDYGEPANRIAITERMFAKAGITKDGAPPIGKAEGHSIGDRIFDKNLFLRGSTLSSIGRDNGREDAGGRFDLLLHGCLEHPRLQVMVKLYTNGIMARSFLVDGEPFGHLGQAAHELEQREKASGKYPRPMWSAGDPEGNAAVS